MSTVTQQLKNGHHVLAPTPILVAQSDAQVIMPSFGKNRQANSGINLIIITDLPCRLLLRLPSDIPGVVET